MKNGKDRNVYDVMNDVNVDIETMDMSDEEKDACVKRLRHKVKEGNRKKSWMEDGGSGSGGCSDPVGRRTDICGRERLAGMVF